MSGGALYANTEDRPTKCLVKSPVTGTAPVSQVGPRGTGQLTTTVKNGITKITGTSLSWDEIAQVVYNAGFRGEDVMKYTAISMRESGRGGTRYLYNPGTKDNSYGPWMMNIWVNGPTSGASEMLSYVVAGGGTKLEDMYDPQIAANAAFHMHARYGDKPWLGYRPGITLADMPQEWIAAATAAAAKITGTVTVTDPTTPITPACGGINSDLQGNGVELKVGGVQYYSQCDPSWKAFTYGVHGDNVCSSGCGPTSVAMIISTLKNDRAITPAVVAKFGQENGTVIIDSDGESRGSYLSIVTKSAANWGFKSKSVSKSEAEMKEIFKAGGYIVDNVGPGDFTSGGHYIVLRGFDANNKLLVSDPNDRQPNTPDYLKKTQTAWDFNVVMSQTKSMIAILP